MTRICASLDSYTGKENLSGADMVEIRTDLFDKIPDIPGKEMLVTFREDTDLSLLPEGYSGMIDIGTGKRPESMLKVISSHHDYVKTPSYDETASILNGMEGDIVKGAFAVRDFNDLRDLMTASKMVKRPHVLIGMGEMGTLTRIRSSLLGNEFTFGYVGKPTAPGQLSLREMSRLKNGCTVLGIIGNPLSQSKSPLMHTAALDACGISGIYLKFETRGINNAANVIREYNVRGVNVTIPYKSGIIGQLDSVNAEAEEIGAVNTVVNDDGYLTGYNTDAAGIEMALERAEFDAFGKRAVIMGSGGAARACAHVLMRKKCKVTVTGRNDKNSETLAAEMGCEWKPKDSVPMQMTDLIVNCTPVGMYNEDSYPLNMNFLSESQAVFDMVYGKDTPMIAAARSAGAKIIYGEDMLAGQGAAAFGLWTGRYDQFDIMRGVLR